MWKEILIFTPARKKTPTYFLQILMLPNDNNFKRKNKAFNLCTGSFFTHFEKLEALGRKMIPFPANFHNPKKSY